jgi:selenocysteine lyase/cysteine desulfurase
VGLSLRHRFAAGRGYLGAATLGLPVDVTRDAVRRDLEKWSTGTADVVEYTALVESARGHAATLLGTTSDRVAIGATASAFVALAAAAAPPGAEVVVVDGDFASVVRPFLAREDLRVTQVPLAGLAEAVGPDTWMVAYALVQSATGEVADAAAVRSAARDHDVRVLVDTTQATGWLPTTDLDADLTVCHTYKWLCGPRGSAFASFSARAQEEIRPLTAGWYSALDPWASCYGPELDLAPDASRYDLSPAWHAWVGAEAALGFTISLDVAEVHAHGLDLANAFRDRLDLGPSDSAIVAWPDPGGAALAAMTTAGITASGRAGRARVSFHLWNDEEDVDLTATALGR